MFKQQFYSLEHRAIWELGTIYRVIKVKERYVFHRMETLREKSHDPLDYCRSIVASIGPAGGTISHKTISHEPFRGTGSTGTELCKSSLKHKKPKLPPSSRLSHAGAFILLAGCLWTY